MANASVEIAESLDIYCRKDDTFNLVLTVQNADTSNFDFTSYSATLNVKKHPSSDTNILSFSSGAGLTLATGSITLAKTAAQMDLEAGVYYYELNVTDASSNVNAWLTGDFIINSDKTNDITSSSTLTVDTTGSAVTLTISGIAGIAAGNDTELQYNNNGVFGGVSELTYNDSTGLLSYQPTLDEATGNEIALNLSYTTNKATSGNDTGLLINQTDTASPGTSYLLDLQVGGTSQFNVANDGNVTLISGSNIYLGSSNTGIGETTANRVGTIIGGSTLFEWYTDGMVSSTPYFPVIRDDVGGFTWQSEAATKLYRTGVNAVAIANSGIDTIQFDASNNVTIPNGDLSIGDSAGLDFTYGKIKFGDGDSYIYETQDDVINVAINSSDIFNFSANGIQSNNANGFRCVNTASGLTTPSLLPRRGNSDSGLGGSSSQPISLIVDGQSALFFDTNRDATFAQGNISITNGVLYLDSYTVAGLPSATTAGGFIYVSDETGGATMAFSDGTNWRRVQDRSIVS